MLCQLMYQQRRKLFISSQRFQRGPFGRPKRSFEDRNRLILNAYKNRRLELAHPGDKPWKWTLKPQENDPKIVQKERKLPSLKEAASPYQHYTDDEIKEIENKGEYFDPLFNPHLYDGVHKVNPEEEPFNAIYSDSKSEAASEYTRVRNITTPELWQYVERLARLKIAPEPQRRKPGEPLYKTPSGFIPPPENPPDLPYFIARTRNHLLPVYYRLHSDPEKCYTTVKQVTGDLWKLEEDLRNHLESLTHSKRRILTSVQETDERVLFRGKYLHEVVDWLHQKGF